MHWFSDGGGAMCVLGSHLEGIHQTLLGVGMVSWPWTLTLGLRPPAGRLCNLHNDAMYTHILSRWQNEKKSENYVNYVGAPDPCQVQGPVRDRGLVFTA